MLVCDFGFISGLISRQTVGSRFAKSTTRRLRRIVAHVGRPELLVKVFGGLGRPGPERLRLSSLNLVELRNASSRQVALVASISDNIYEGRGIMSAKQLAKILAVCVGCFLVISASTEAGNLLVTARTANYLDSKPELYALAIVPIAIALMVSFLLYLYAKRLSTDDIKPREIEILAVGLKLMGIYALIESIPHLSAVVTTMLYDFPADSVVNWGVTFKLGLTGIAYVIVGTFMVCRTQWLISRISR